MLFSDSFAIAIPADWTCTAKDIISQKLRYGEKGGKVVREQRDNLLGILKVNAANLDFEQLLRWSDESGIVSLALACGGNK